MANPVTSYLNHQNSRGLVYTQDYFGDFVSSGEPELFPYDELVQSFKLQPVLVPLSIVEKTFTHHTTETVGCSNFAILSCPSDNTYRVVKLRKNDAYPYTDSLGPVGWNFKDKLGCYRFFNKLKPLPKENPQDKFYKQLKKDRSVYVLESQKEKYNGITIEDKITKQQFTIGITTTFPKWCEENSLNHKSVHYSLAHCNSGRGSFWVKGTDGKFIGRERLGKYANKVLVDSKTGLEYPLEVRTTLREWSLANNLNYSSVSVAWVRQHEEKLRRYYIKNVGEPNKVIVPKRAKIIKPKRVKKILKCLNKELVNIRTGQAYLLDETVLANLNYWCRQNQLNDSAVRSAVLRGVSSVDRKRAWTIREPQI
jgi:hypothetical protein